MTLRRSDVTLDDDQRADCSTSSPARPTGSRGPSTTSSGRAGSTPTRCTYDPELRPGALVDDVVEPRSARISTGRTSSRSIAEPTLPAVAGDPDKVGRVLINLVDNAVKYSPDGGRVTVRVGARRRLVCASRCRRGARHPASEQRRVFEKFYRLDPNMNRGVGGTGLGLYICRELVRRMDGRIWVESPGLGRARRSWSSSRRGSTAYERNGRPGRPFRQCAGTISRPSTRPGPSST